MENKLRTYETICLTKVDMPEEKFNALMDRCKSSVVNEGTGQWLYSDDWGKSKIAFRIEKDNRAKWTYFRFKSTSKGVDELQRGLRINEYVLRQLTTRASEDGADYESIRANMPKDLADRERQREWRDERPFRGGRNFKDRGDRGEGYERKPYGSRRDETPQAQGADDLGDEDTNN